MNSLNDHSEKCLQLIKVILMLIYGFIYSFSLLACLIKEHFRLTHTFTYIPNHGYLYVFIPVVAVILLLANYYIG